MELTQEENDFFEKEKSEIEKQISEHQKLKEEYMDNEKYEKAKKENETIEKLKLKLQSIETEKLEKVQKKEIVKLHSNYDEIIKETKNKYETQIKEAEDELNKILKEMENKYKRDLKEIEKKYIMEKKHSPEYKAMEKEEKKLLKDNRFDEAIALQKLRKKKEEEDNKRYFFIYKNEIETLKRNLTVKYNKEVNNFKDNKKNEIELIRNEMNLTLDNIDKQFNNRRHDLITIQKTKGLIKINVPLAKSRQIYKKTSTASQNASFNRIFGPLSMSLNEQKIPKKKMSSQGKRFKYAKIDK